MRERLAVPRLRVRRDWFRGLAADPVDHSNPDIGDTDAETARARVPTIILSVAVGLSNSSHDPFFTPRPLTK